VKGAEPSLEDTGRGADRLLFCLFPSSRPIYSRSGFPEFTSGLIPCRCRNEASRLLRTSTNVHVAPAPSPGLRGVDEQPAAVAPAHRFSRPPGNPASSATASMAIRCRDVSRDRWTLPKASGQNAPCMRPPVGSLRSHASSVCQGLLGPRDRRQRPPRGPPDVVNGFAQGDQVGPCTRRAHRRRGGKRLQGQELAVRPSGPPPVPRTGPRHSRRSQSRGFPFRPVTVLTRSRTGCPRRRSPSATRRGVRKPVKCFHGLTSLLRSIH